MGDLQHFIDGRFQPGHSGETFRKYNPATGHAVADVALGGAEDVDQAVMAARRSFPAWSATSLADRGRTLHRIADQIEARADELAYLESIDTGKPLSLARRLDIPRAASNFRFFADFVQALSTEAFEMDGGALNYSLRRAVGVAGLISPWNLPLLLLTWKLAPALAAGNTVVAKPAELTPTTATKLAELCSAAGLPDGVFNVVHGFGPSGAGEWLTRHPHVALISLTGESATGKAIMAQAAPTLKRVSFELGGKNPLVVFADADLDMAVTSIIQSSFANQGEVCLCGSRIYVERPIYDAFLERFVEATARLTVGDPLDPGTDLGALISGEHLEKVEGYLRIAEREGGKFLTGSSQRLAMPHPLQGGHFVAPTIIADLSQSCRVVTEEVFGPVVTVHPFDSEAEVLGWANASPYGLSATVWTQNLSRAHRVAAAIDAGVVWVNTWFLRDLRTPFGGSKESGIGREGGIHSFEFFSELKNICIKW